MQKYPDAMPHIIQFKARLSPFGRFMFHQCVLQGVSPLAWWLSMSEQIHPELSLLVRSLFSAVASSAGVERVFSTFGFIHSDVRNRLGVDKAAKLSFIYKMLNGN